MPARWRIVAPGIDSSQVKVEHLHAVVSGWLDAADTAHNAPAKPYAVSPPAPCDGGTAFEVGLLDDALADRLLTRAAPGARSRFGAQHTRFGGQPRQVAAEPWSELARPMPVSAWCLRFVTPTTFRRGNAFTPNPSLKAIVGSLRRSWQRHAPPAAVPVALGLSLEPLWLTDIDIASHVLKVDGRTVSGFTGRLRFACDGPDEVAAAVDRVVRLAPYAGVGAHTTRGFGVTRLETTWPARGPAG